MATIVLSSIGSLFGPLGQIVGSLAGNVIDNALFGAADREGPRLKELAVTSSSYGNPIARQYGTMRVPGTIVWSTDLKEHREKQSNGKDAPSTTTYSYSVSFAVALSSASIDRVGRIWADGNLLRGAAGDLKSSGTLRVHRGFPDQAQDPLLAAELGNSCPAFRGTAYAVFEDLDLTDFGNRIPALTFEVFAGHGAEMVRLMLGCQGVSTTEAVRFQELSGFSHEGGSLRDVTELVSRLYPLSPRVTNGGLIIAPDAHEPDTIFTLPPPAAWDEGEYGKQSGQSLARGDNRSAKIAAIRYYDPAREYQPGLQHAHSTSGDLRTFQFPGAFAAKDALALVRKANRRAAVARDRLAWRCAELDPRMEPGSLVSAPGHPGIWSVVGWEWRERGIELELVRYRNDFSDNAIADPGSSWTPADRAASGTLLRVFEVPWDGSGSSSVRRIFAAAAAQTGRWSGAALYADQAGSLIALGQSAGERAIAGELAQPLGPSSAIRYEPEAVLRVQLMDAEAQFETTDITGMAQGANRLLVGGEVIQFAQARALGNGLWELGGLLRGRGGTEIEAARGHAQLSSVTLLDERLIALGENRSATSAENFAAIGLWDTDPSLAALENAHASLRPPCPVHTELAIGADGTLRASWRRRARGQWLWLDEVSQPLVEESERYEIGLGPVDTPLALWTSSNSSFALSSNDLQSLRAEHGAQHFWVRQVGSFAKSRASLLGMLPA